ncbi:MAG: hypothetical protein LBK67_11050 [Coriobacteriales bacterium]|jgi:hypothetical protein|nr:hypothetical protein [Coriobacteriales bacterium]
MSDDIYAVIDRQEDVAKRAKARGGGSDGQKPYNKEEYAAKKKAERDSAYLLIETVAQRISEDPVAFKDYLDVTARFLRYSTNNTLLIFGQMPDAVRLGDFDAWKRRGASVAKGAHAIAILEPGDEYTREDGTIGVSYNVKKVFDECQTSARHLEPRYADTHTLLTALINTAPVAITTVEEMPQEQGHVAYDHKSRKVLVTRGLDGEQLFKAIATELAHAVMAGRSDTYDYKANSTTAQLAAYVVAGRFGVDNSEIMPVLSVASQDGLTPDVHKELVRIHDVSKAISDCMNLALETSKTKDALSEHASPSRGGKDVR